MEWTREKTLALISEYRKRRGLWDMTDDDYRKKEVKHRLLKAVSDNLGGDIAITEIEKKFHTLRTQYHREINRMKRKEPYNSKWFGFKYLQFLSSPKACRSSKGRIKAEITEEGAVTTKFIIREAASTHDTSVGSCGTGSNASPNENDEFLTLQRVGNCNVTTHTHELEKLIEETTKDVEDIEDSKPKMTLKQITMPLEQHHQHHDYNGGELQINSVESEQEEIHQMQEIDDNMEVIHNAPEEDITYQGNTSTSSTMVASHSQSGTATLHAIPARIIKIQRRDTTNHENTEFYANNSAHQHHVQHPHHHQEHQHHIHTLSPNGTTATTTTKRIYYDTNNGQYTATIAPSDPLHQGQPANNLKLLSVTTSPRSCSLPTAKIQIRNNLSSSNQSVAMAAPVTVTMRDECGTYGEYVANEMRNIKGREILVSLKHKINTALFEANMADLQK